MRIEAGKRVKLEYELSVDGGEMLESSATGGPLEYIHGSGRMLPGLERRLAGCQVGDEREGVLLAVEAYGSKDELPIRQLQRSDFPDDEPIELGKRFEAKGPDGSSVTFEVESVDDESVTVRFRHPLVGKNIAFRFKVLEVTDPEQN